MTLTQAEAKTKLPASFPIIWKGDTGYEKARIGRVFNYRRPDRFPVAVVEATAESHIVETVRLAAKMGYRVSARSGGHSWAVWSVRDEAILIDLGRYHEFSFDTNTGIATASPSTTGRLINKLLEPYGRIFPGGHCPEVALGGFLLQGGMGWNCKNWGWACERVLAVDIITADGERLHCNRSQNIDLYWAARGAGPGFPAIVTRFHLQTLPAFTHMRSSAYIYKKEDYRRVFSWILSLAPTYDVDTEIVMVGKYTPGQTEVNMMVLLLAFKNSEAEARAALQTAEVSAPAGPTDRWFCKATSLAQEYDDQQAANPMGHRYCVDNCYVADGADVVSVLEDAFTKLPSRRSFSLWYSMAPGSQRDAGSMDDMALSMQTDHYFATYTIWEDAADDELNCRWVNDTLQAIGRHAVGSYLGDADFQVRQTQFWEAQKGHRLMQIRRDRDRFGRSGTKGLANVHEWKP
ncbi:oxidoreductase [Grosmannia clavigera kw1407]|uniref:Oxidoreductase n=1 Tax=Grosmannia clavigera (strain kw1407 / UAMH 11150) TaxID=655863 RepID=F0XEC7_GROCL|nr:oxidoreductase [Grosmannia clavigera kw1407]EFX03505.1 oxidoreductase [Grosmannia clavigera kw1407]